MRSSVIVFSAEFGGQDAADALLPHFWALKSAAKGIELRGFPFPQLAFILRGDGEVHKFGLVGAGHLEVDKDCEYLSIDIGVRENDRQRIADVILDGITSSVDLIKAAEAEHGWSVNWEALAACLDELGARYRDELATRQ